MKSKLLIINIILIFMLLTACSLEKSNRRISFNSSWRFHLGEIEMAMNPDFNDSSWRELNVPHDWSIEGEFSPGHPATPGGGALPGGIGWYRKSFFVNPKDSDKLHFIDFDGVYCNSEVWINGNYLGIRPFGYSSFRYELTPHLKYGENENTIAVKVDNSMQPNSRWYSGSGIYRNVWLVCTDKIFVDHWGTYITTPAVSNESAAVTVETNIKNTFSDGRTVSVKTVVLDNQGKKVTETFSDIALKGLESKKIKQDLTVQNPQLWSVKNPLLYTAVTTLKVEGKVKDKYETPFGIRYFSFDTAKGFLLNGEKVKINGVCNHHDLGCLGAAINTRALERQLEILKGMGCNGIRTSHNPPAPELLDLCDKMGFIVMDEAFDMWKKGKTPHDYSLHFEEWHKRDLQDLIYRDRNHPSVFIWSIGNEILEQWDTSGVRIALELTSIVREVDTTRPVTSGCNDPNPWNNIIRSGALDLIGYNYHHHMYEDFPKTYPGQKFISTESVSGLATRGSYDMPSDSVRRWPVRWDLPLTTGNADYSCSSYDNCSAPWGSTHAETWRVMKKHDYLSGMFIWTGWDYLGEPTPYSWPARSSYFGIIDLAGFPKDIYYFYQSEWTDKPVLHIFPHWNWNEGDTVDIWAYTNYSEVEIFLNDKSLGRKVKTDDDLHLSWRVAYQPGTVSAVALKDGVEPIEKVVKTAGKPEAIVLEADRTTINADGRDLSFVTVKIVDAEGNLVPYAENLVNFEISGGGFIAGVDNGSQISHEPFKADYRKAFKGMCLAVIQSNGNNGKISFKATSEGLKNAAIELNCVK
ncbi:MAG: glycoside hydrolase family 2 protein [Bacteroidales bacterium]|nr:glycoside hydrolase family 2 protein [Bacteroidales bacterium]